MSSAIPYDPDGFEDNNPFAEPVNVLAPPPDEEPIVEEPAPVDEAQPPAEPQDSGTLSQDELRKLVPERFSNKYSLKFKLTGIEKNKPGNPILKFDVVVTNLPRYRQSDYKEVRRTYSEVAKFNKYLTVSNLECFVPQIPPVMTSYPHNGEDEKKQLISVWQEWFDRITSNPILIRDEEFVYFVENDFGYSVINSNRKTAVASGLIRKTLKQLAAPYDPYQDLADFRPIVKGAYLTCQRLHKLLDRTSKSERQLAAAVSELAQKLNSLSQFEVIHPGMKNMWEKLAKIKSVEADLILMESYSDMGSLGDGILHFINDFYEIKEALTNRHLIMREHLQAQQQTRAKHLSANKIKNKTSLDPIRVDEAIRSLEYATKAEESLDLQVKRITGEMLFERQEVIDHTESKFRNLLKNYTLNKVEHHRKILKHLETIRLDIRIIDERGGLSRLNRENLGNLKHNLTQSQSTAGDSWSSRTFRSLNTEQEIKEQQHDIQEEAAPLPDSTIDAKNAANLLGLATF